MCFERSFRLLEYESSMRQMPQQAQQKADMDKETNETKETSNERQESVDQSLSKKLSGRKRYPLQPKTPQLRLQCHKMLWQVCQDDQMWMCIEGIF